MAEPGYGEIALFDDCMSRCVRQRDSRLHTALRQGFDGVRHSPELRDVPPRFPQIFERLSGTVERDARELRQRIPQGLRDFTIHAISDPRVADDP